MSTLPTGREPPSRYESLASGAVLLALVAFALIRVQVVDLPWHLATARLARATGHWPELNTFSYTFQDYPLYQQYPFFQATLYAIFQRGGWAALSVVSCVGWSAVFLLFVRWAGTWRQAVPRALFWMLGLYALQRRMILRPDMFTMLALGGMLLSLRAYARGHRWWIAGVPLIHVAWVNSHQLFPLSLMIQGLFVAHLVLARLGRWGVDRSDAPVPVGPPVAALALSTVLCLATPLGFSIVHVTAHTWGSLTLLRDQVSEFTRLWQTPHELVLAILTGSPAAWALWCSRHRWSPFDVGLWLGSLFLVLSAVRGLMFFGIISVAVLERTALRLEAAGEGLTRELRPLIGRAMRTGGTTLTLILAASVVYHRWVRPPLMLGGTQPGIGRSLGGWADEAIAFLRANPPPGRMMNMSWRSGNALIWGLPTEPVFVDPRFESYPHPFLREVADSYGSDDRLARLIERFQPSWIFAEHFRDPVRDRAVALVRKGWTPVYADSAHLILVRPGTDTAAYRASHVVDWSAAIPDLLPGPPELRAQQIARFERLRSALSGALASRD